MRRVLFAVVLVVLWRGSLRRDRRPGGRRRADQPGLIIAITILALGAAGSGPSQPSVQVGLTLDASLLELIFGVALVAYFGHTSAGHAAKVVLARDPSGRHLWPATSPRC